MIKNGVLPPHIEKEDAIVSIGHRATYMYPQWWVLLTNHNGQDRRTRGRFALDPAMPHASEV